MRAPCRRWVTANMSLTGRAAVWYARVQERLSEELAPRIDSPEGSIKITDCYMPWNRMFEVGLSVQYVSG